MKCPKCGNDLPVGSEFCQYCGTKIEVITDSNTHATDNAKEPIETEKSELTPNTTFDFLPAKDKEVSNHAVNPTVFVSALEKNDDTISVLANKQKTSKKVKDCKYCGGVIDSDTKKCSLCGRQYFRLKITTPLIILAIIAVVLASLNVAQYIYGKTKVNELEIEISSREATINSQKNKIADLEDKANNYDDICSMMSSGNIGYAAANFKSSESIIVLQENELNRKFTLTANWISGGSVSADYSSFAASVSFDNDSWYTSTTMTINPMHEGATVVTFSNDVDSKAFKILIIVTD